MSQFGSRISGFFSGGSSGGGGSQDLQQVTDIGNTTTNPIVIESGTFTTSYEYNRIYSDNSADNENFIINFPATDDHTINFPNDSGTLALSVNGQSANSSGAITISAVTGTGTNNEIAYFDTTGSTIASLTTTTYPSLTELSYVKGVTSAIQTQLDNKGYAINLGSASTNLSASTTYYFGVPQLTTTGTSAIRRVYIPQSGTIIGGQIYMRTTSATSTENWTISIRLNNTTNTTFATVGNNSQDKVFGTTSLNILVVTGDYIEITTTTPAWSISAGATFIYGSIFIK